jgi:transposase
MKINKGMRNGGCTRYRRLVAKGKHANVVTGAMARELAGFMWAMAKEVPVTA